MQVRSVVVVAGAAFLLAGSTAWAGGFETPENGSTADGRAGAFVARATGPEALMLNVAGIGTGAPEGHPLQIYVGANLDLYNNCFQRAGTYDSPRSGASIDLGGGAGGTPATIFSTAHPYYGTGNTPYPQVCNGGAPFIAPNILATYAVSRRFGVGIGVYGPNSVGNGSYSGNGSSPETVNVTVNGMTELAPNPARYVLDSENLLIAHLAIGASYEVIPGVLRIGATAEPSIARLSFVTMANPSGAQSPASDLQTTVTATGMFFAGAIGALFSPTSFLQFGVNAHLTTPISASGSGSAIGNFYAANAADRLITSNIGVHDMSVSLPQQVRVGARFVIPRAGEQRLNDPAPARAYVPMRDEVADIEIDGIWEGSSSYQSLNLGFNPSPGVCVSPAPGTTNNCGSGALTPPLPGVSIPHQWTNVWGVRLGGDWNILRDQLAVRAGVAYETAAETPQYMNLDLPGQQTFSIHAGATYRINHRFSINIAYAHQIIATVDNASIVNASSTSPATDSNTGVRTIGTNGLVTNANCNSTSGTGACTNNAGTFTSSLDVVSLGFNLAF